MTKSPENQGKSLFTSEQCSNCELKPAVFLYYVWHKGRYLHICTACILSLHQGAFCPICFNVYDDHNSPPKDCVKCCRCKSVCHLNCISKPHFDTSILPGFYAAPSSSSVPMSAQSWVCPYCSDPNLKFFQVIRDEISEGVKIDSYLASQMLAAATISKRSILKAVTMTTFRANILCKEAAEAKKEAKEALRNLDESTFTPQEGCSKSMFEFESTDDGSDDDATDYLTEDESGNASDDENQNE